MQALYKIFTPVLVIFLLVSASGDEVGLYKRVENAASSSDVKSIDLLAKEYLRRYPGGEYTADCLYYLAGTSTVPDDAIRKYRDILDKFPQYKRSTDIHIALCEIYSLTARWESLKQESFLGIAGSKLPADSARFRFFLLEALINMGRFNRAENEVSAITDNNHDYETLSRTLFMKSRITYRKRGMSSDYAITLRELVSGFRESSHYPSILYLLGEFYEATGDTNRAYSAYLDLAGNYPRSPESILINSRLKKLKNSGSRIVQYIPDEKVINRMDPIDIRPEIDEPEIQSGILYAVSIGPLSSQKQAQEIRRFAERIAPCGTVLLKRGYMIYCGKFSSSDEALARRVRLAEEYGINGSVVRLQSAPGRQYIYGE